MMTDPVALPCLKDPMPQASADAPIGIFDSGVGGLSIAQEIEAILPKRGIFFFAIPPMCLMVRVKTMIFGN